MQENVYILHKIGNAVRRLHGRSIGERRALFFATFMIAVSLIFSIWARHMYQRFGVVFSPGVIRQAEQERGGARQTTEKNTAPASLTPFATLRENLATLRSGSYSFFSGVFSMFDQPSGALTVVGEDEEKKPPVSGVQQDALFDDPLLRENTESPLPSTEPVEEEKSAVPSGTENPALFAGDRGLSVAADHAQVIAEQKSGEDIPEVVFVEVSAEEARAVSQMENVQAPISALRFFAILRHNIEAIRHGAADFYEYITR